MALDANAFTIAGTVMTALKHLKDIIDSQSNSDMKQQLGEVYDQLFQLKHQAVLLDDENRELKHQLRFRSDEYTFDGAFFYHKSNPTRALCPKCHVAEKDAPMGHPFGEDASRRECLACGSIYEIPGASRTWTPSYPQNNGPDGWMGD